MERSTTSRGSVRWAPIAAAGVAVLASGGTLASLFGLSAAGAAIKRTAPKVVISTGKNAQLGTILVDARTVYTLVPSKIPCTAQCLKIWPAITLPKGVKRATAGSGVNAARLGVIRRPNGVMQVTYFGRALYWFVGDRAPGQVHGNITDKWGRWSTFVTVKPKIASTATRVGTTVTTTAGSGGIAF